MGVEQLTPFDPATFLESCFLEDFRAENKPTTKPNSNPKSTPPPRKIEPTKPQPVIPRRGI
jgi:hypothetical protein